MYFTPQIINLNLVDDSTEYLQVIPANTRKVVLKVRGSAADVRLAFKSGETASNYIEIAAGETFSIDDVYLKDVEMYLKASDPSVVAEILIFT